MNNVNLFERIKPEFIDPIKHLLNKYNVYYEYEGGIYPDELGYYIRDGVLKIKASPIVFSMGHELAHMVLINNFEKLLIDNWGFPVINETFNSKTLRKFLLNECKVWAIENFLYKTGREVNEDFIKTAIEYNTNKAYLKLFRLEDDIDIEFNEVKEKVLNRMNRYSSKINFNDFINELEIRLAFVKNHIDNNPGFNSIKFDFIKEKKVKL